MADAGGPGTHNVKPCTTLGLADLGDTKGFDDPGMENKLYAFQLSEGLYKRKEVNVGGDGALTFGELTDVNVDGVEQNKPYQFILNENNVWGPYEDPIEAAGGWEIDMQIIQPYITIGKNHEFRKLQNSGTLLCSYHTRQDNVIVKNTDFGYAVGMRGKKKGSLRLNKEFDFGSPAENSVIILDVVLGDASDEFKEVIKGLNIKWNAKNANKPLTIYIKKQSRGVDPVIRFSLEDILQNVPLLSDLNFDFIHIGALDFKRIRYTTLPLSSTYLKIKLKI